MATGFNAGSAYVKILPSLQGFAPKLRAELSRIHETVKVKVEPDVSGLRAEVQAAATAATAGVRADVEVGVDAAGLRQALRAAVDAAAAGVTAKVKVELEADTAELRSRLGAIGDLRVKVKLDPDIAALRALLNALPPIDVRVDLDPDLAALRARLASANLRTTVEVDADRGGSLSSAGGHASNLERNLKLAAAAAVALAASAPSLAPLISALAGAAGAAGLIPAAITAAGASFAAIKIGTSGVSDAFTAMGAAQEASGASGAAAAAAQEASAKKIRDAIRGEEDARRQATRTAIDGDRQVADARRSRDDAITAGNQRVADAELRLKEVQENRRRTIIDLVRAIETEKEAQEDLALSLRGAALSEESAVLGLERARQRLANMPKDSTALDYKEAELSVRQASLAVDETRERHVDLQQASKQSAEAGIAGAEGVMSANDRLTDANRTMYRAEVDLAQARQERDQDVQRANEQLVLAQESARQANEDAARSVARAQEQLAEAYTSTGTAASTSGDKAANALAKLAPAARAYVDAVKALAPAWGALKMDVQQRLFDGLGSSLSAMATAQLPGVRAGLADIAGGFNEAAQGALGFLASSAAVRDVRQILADTGVTTGLFAGALTPITRMFVDIAAVGAPILTELAQGFAGAADRAAAFIANARATGELDQWIRAGLESLRQLGELFGNIGGSIKAIFDAASTAGSGTLGPLLMVTGEIERFLKSTEGQGALVAIFTAIQDIVRALMPAVSALLSAFSAGIQAIAPALVPLANVFSLLVQAATPLIEVVAGVAAVFLDLLARVISPLIPVVSVIADVIGTVLNAALRSIEPIIPVIVRAFEQMAPVLSQIAIMVGDVLVAALDSLAPLWPVLTEAVLLVLDALLDLLPTLIQIYDTVWSALLPALTPLAQAFVDVLKAILPIVPLLADFVLQFYQGLAPILPVIIGLFIDLVNALIPLIPPLLRIAAVFLDGIIATLKILLPIVVELVRILVDVLVWALDNVVVPALNVLADVFEWIQQVWGNVGKWLSDSWATFSADAATTWTGVKDTILGAWTNIQSGTQEKWTALTTWLSQGWADFTAGWNAFWQGVLDWEIARWNDIQTTAMTTWDSIRGFFGERLAEFATFWSNTWQTIKNWVSTKWSEIQADLTAKWEAIRAFFTARLAEFSAAWNQMWTATRDFIGARWEDIKNGLNSTWLWIKANVFDRLVSFVTVDIPNAFNRAVEGIRGAWDRIREITAAPIRFMVNVVYNGGIVPAWNFVAGIVGLGKLAPVTLPFADGGVLPGYTPGRDPHKFYSPTGGRLDMSGGEAIMRPEWTRAVGVQGVEIMNRAARTGGTRAVRDLLHLEGDPSLKYSHGGVLPHQRFAYGGVMGHVAAAGDEITRLFGRMPGGIGGVGARANASDHPKGLALDFMTMNNRGLGDRVAGHMAANAARLAMKYQIWLQRIQYPGGGWRGMENRGSPTANHMDHVHVSFMPRPGMVGTDPGGGGGIDPVAFVMEKFGAVLNAVKTMAQFGNSQWGQGAIGMGKKMVDGAIATAIQKATSLFTVEVAGSASADPSSAGAIAAVDSVAQGYAWGKNSGAQWNSLFQLIQKESSWNPRAQNPTSTAYGLFQFLNSTWGSVGGAKTSDPRMQAVYGLKYIAQRYRDPVGAWNFHKKNNWYDDGGLARGRGVMLKNVIEPERTLSPRQTVAFEQLVAHLGSGYQQQQMPVLAAEQWAARGSAESSPVHIEMHAHNPIAESTSESTVRMTRTASAMGMFG